MNLDALKQLKSKRTTNLKKLQERAEKAKGGDNARDERLYKPKMKNGGNTVTLRFLPPKEGENPLVEVKSHAFKGPETGTWYIQNSRQNLLDANGEPQPDPVNIACINAYRKRKATGDEEYGKIGKMFLPRSRFYANALIIKDEVQPEREGEVVIFDFGPQINKIIEESINPSFDDIDPVDPFDLWGGADFYVRMQPKQIPDNKNKNGGMATVPDYGKSGFGNPKEFGTDEEKIEAVNKTHNLDELVSADKHKPFDELAKMFKRAFGRDYDWLDPDYTDRVVDKIEKPMRSEEPEDIPSDDDVPPFDGGHIEPQQQHGEPEDSGETLSVIEKLKRLQNEQK